MLRWATSYRRRLSEKSKFTNNEKNRKGCYLLSPYVCQGLCHVSGSADLPIPLFSGEKVKGSARGPAWAQADLQPRCVINNLPSLSVKMAMSEPMGMSYFSCALTKYLTKKGGFILIHSLSAQGLTGEEVAAAGGR